MLELKKLIFHIAKTHVFYVFLKMYLFLQRFFLFTLSVPSPPPLFLFLFTPISFLTVCTQNWSKIYKTNLYSHLLRKQCAKGYVRVYDFYAALSVNINLSISEIIVLLVSSMVCVYFHSWFPTINHPILFIIIELFHILPETSRQKPGYQNL